MNVLNINIANNINFVNKGLNGLSKNHEGKHILFIGDSFAAGDGLSFEDTWCYKVYNKISYREKTSGYYNLGLGGSSIYESIDIFFRYCFEYAKPDVVFFVTTEMSRDLKYFNKKLLQVMVKKMYFYLEQYCESNNIQLYSFSWIKSLDQYSKEPKRSTVQYQGNDLLVPLWTDQVDLDKSQFGVDNFNEFKTFYNYDSKKMLNSVFEYDKKSKTPKKSLWATDNRHPGTSFHDFYAEFIYQKYVEKNK